MKDLRSRPGARRMRELVAEGEHEHQDFKYAITDARKIARSISAFSNRHGGRLLIGVKDNGVIAGVRTEEDVYVVELAAASFCRPAVQVEFKAWSVEAGVTVIEACIPRAEGVPVSVDEGGGRTAYYCRIADSNILVPELFSLSRELRAGSCGACLPEGTPQIVEYYRESRPADARSLALNLHIPEESAMRAIINLVALDILRFGWKKEGFTLIASADTSETEEMDALMDALKIKKFGELKEI